MGMKKKNSNSQVHTANSTQPFLTKITYACPSHPLPNSNFRCPKLPHYQHYPKAASSLLQTTLTSHV